MSPTPVTFTLPTAPPGYAWEATSEAVAERYGIPIDQIARFDLNTAPAAPETAVRILAAGRLDTPLSEYPPSDYRRLAAAAAARYAVNPDEVLVGAGADEILDIVAKAFLPANGSAVVPSPTYAMYRILTEQRPASVIAVPRLGQAAGYALDLPAVRTAASSADLVWLCSPNNPTGLPEPEGAIEELLGHLAGDASAAGRPAPAVVLDEAYAEFVGTSLVRLRDKYPRLVVVRTLSKAYALAGLRVGFAIARPETIAAIAPYRPPGSVSVVSVSIAAEVLEDPDILDGTLGRTIAERERVAVGLRAAGWLVGRSVTNFLLVDLDTPERAAAVAEALLSRGLVPRTFGPRHPLVAHLRITVRDTEQDDRLIAAALELGSAPDLGSARDLGSAPDLGSVRDLGSAPETPG
ncbi:MAG TPA: aminotransferase class I/II-fold pyridoxal phosphate-dependent enzyme [Candidatus Eisenbacteria bacterium]|nr:aminotransferase class I/II-fold pyridoxal phosphate-dependent enzyme [Candidatus Eisenbacteria bacterium]